MVLYKNDIAYYLVGSTWTLSDETYAQSNTVAELLVQKATFATVGIHFNVGIFYHSDDGSTTPVLSELSITYDFNGDPGDSISICEVWWYSRKADGTVCLDSIAFKIGIPDELQN